jgi:phage shock protein C
MIFGVAGGFADWLDVDPAVVRIVLALLALAGGTGILLYIVAAIVIPEEPWEPVDAVAAGADAGATSPSAFGSSGSAATSAADASRPAFASSAPPTAREARDARRAARREARRDGEGRGLLVLGAILVLVGAWFLARDFLPFFDDRLVAPVVLIGIGVLFLAASMRRDRGGTPR